MAVVTQVKIFNVDSNPTTTFNQSKLNNLFRDLSLLKLLASRLDKKLLTKGTSIISYRKRDSKKDFHYSLITMQIGLLN